MYGLVRCLAECTCFSVMHANIIGQVMPDFLDYGLLPRGIFGRRRGPFQSFTVKRVRRRKVDFFGFNGASHVLGYLDGQLLVLREVFGWSVADIP